MSRFSFDRDEIDYLEIGDWFASRYHIPTDDNRREERWAICRQNRHTGDLEAVTWRPSRTAAIAYIDQQLSSQVCGR